MKKTLIIIAVIAVLAGGYWFRSQNGAPSGGPPPGFGGPVLVVAELVEPRPLVTSVEALGTAKANESVTLASSLTDTVRRVNFDDGDFVEAGVVLVELTNEEEEAQLAEARANLDDARRQLRRLDDLDARGIAAASDVDEARALSEGAEARLNTVLARLEDRLIRAPFPGLLGFREVSPGTLLTPGDPITTIDDIATIKLDFTIPETALGRVQPGKKVYARSAGWRDRIFEGEVRTVASRVDPVTRAAVVRAIVDNTDGALRPGMLLTVQLVTEERTAIMIPERSIVQVGEGASVYLVDEEKRAIRQPVQLGTRQAGDVEIAEGLQEGDRIVTEGIVKLRDGATVRFAEDGPQRLAAPADGTTGASGPADEDGEDSRPQRR